MRIHWWQSIRWRLALGSMLVALMATALLALTSLVAIVYYYTIDQRDQLAQIAADRAQRIGADYSPGVGGLVKAVYTVLPSNRLMQDSQSEQYLLVVFNRAGSVIYPRVTQRTGVVVKPGTVAAYLLNLANPSLQKDDYSRIHQEIHPGMKGTTTISHLNDNRLISLPLV